MMKKYKSKTNRKSEAFKISGNSPQRIATTSTVAATSSDTSLALRSMLRNDCGVSLISVLVSMGILTVVFLSGLQMTNQTTIGQSQVEFQSKIALARYSILQTVLYDPTWDWMRERSVVANGLNCTWDPAQNCNGAYTLMTTTTSDLTDDAMTHVYFGNKNASGLAAASRYVLWTLGAGSGLPLGYDISTTHNVSGTTNFNCATTGTAAERADCPFTMSLVWHPVDCTGTPCNPNQIRLVFIPAINTNIVTSAEMRKHLGAFNVNRYGFDIVRPTRSSGEYFSVADISDAIPQALTGAGNTTTRNLNTVRYDVGSNVTAIGPSSVTIRAGVYNCEISAPACAVGSHSIRLENVSAGNAVLLEAVPSYAYASTQDEHCNRSVVSGKIDLNEASVLRIRHVVEDASGPTDSGGKDVGNGNVYTVMSCIKEQ